VKGLAIVVAGNLSDGFRFFGPFEDFDAAAEWCEGFDMTPTWVSTLECYGPEPDEMAEAVSGTLAEFDLWVAKAKAVPREG